MKSPVFGWGGGLLLRRGEDTEKMTETEMEQGSNRPGNVKELPGVTRS